MSTFFKSQRRSTRMSHRIQASFAYRSHSKSAKGKTVAVREFEMLHGVVLTKLMRTGGASLRLVETDTKQAWAAYRLNEEIIVYVKYRLGNRFSERKQKLAWTFLFNSPELTKINQLNGIKPIYLALVCGLPEIATESLEAMQIAILSHSQTDKCLDLRCEKPQSISVEYRAGESLRVYGKRNSAEANKIVVARNRLDTFVVPGS